MNEDTLRRINIATLPAIVVIGLLCWFCLPRELFSLWIFLSLLMIMFVAYVNIRKPILDFIDARRKAKNKPVDVKGETWIKTFNLIAFFSILAFILIAWTGLGHDLFGWAIIFVVMALAVVFLVNARKIISDIS